MSKLIIWVSGSVAVNGHRIREFLFSPAHKKHIWRGQEWPDVEFNAEFEKAWKNNSDLRPKAMVVETSRPAPVTQATAPAPVSTITAHEITADEAEEVLLRLRPERLKKKTGPKPAIMEVA